MGHGWLKDNIIRVGSYTYKGLGVTLLFLYLYVRIYRYFFLNFLFHYYLFNIWGEGRFVRTPFGTPLLYHLPIRHRTFLSISIVQGVNIMTTSTSISTVSSIDRFM